MKLTATTPAIKWIKWFSKQDKNIYYQIKKNQIHKIKKKNCTNNGLLEVQTITKQEILINKEIEKNTFPAYKSLPLPQS